MATEWFCKIMGSEYGPMSQQELVERIRQKNIGPEDLVRKGDSVWLAVFEIPGLMDAANKPAEETADDQEQSKASEANTGSANGSAANEADWYCLASGEKKGPLRFDQLQDLVRQGHLRAKDRVWRTSRPKFRPASEVEGLDV